MRLRTATTRRLLSAAAEAALPLRRVAAASMPVEEFRARALDVEPLIIIGAMEAWPALRDWSDLEKLKTRAGDARGRVEVGINFLDPDLEVMENVPVAQYIELALQDVHANEAADEDPRRAYMAQSQVFEGEAARDLRADFSAPYLIADRAFSTSLYLGPRHTITPLHCDPGHTLLAQVFGRKVVHVVPAAQRALVYPFSELYRRHVSMVDPERPDLAAFPDFLRADVFKDTLMPGELLYLPARWWHHVRSLDPACSLSFMWFEPKSESERAAHAAVVAAAAAAP